MSCFPMQKQRQYKGAPAKVTQHTVAKSRLNEGGKKRKKEKKRKRNLKTPVLIIRGKITATLQYFRCTHSSITESIPGTIVPFTISAT